MPGDKDDKDKGRGKGGNINRNLAPGNLDLDRFQYEVASEIGLDPNKIRNRGKGPNQGKR